MKISLYLTLLLTLFIPFLRAMEMPLSVPRVDLKEQLLEAMRSNDKKLVHDLIKQGIPINTADKNGRTVLSYAAAYGYLDLAQEALAAGANVNHAHGLALNEAVLHQHKGIVKLLLSSGADPALNLETWDTQLNTHLAQFADLGLDELVTEQLKRGVFKGINDALLKAVLKGNSDLVRTLIRNGATPNPKVLKRSIKKDAVIGLKTLFSVCPDLTLPDTGVAIPYLPMYKLLLSQGAPVNRDGLDDDHMRLAIQFGRPVEATQMAMAFNNGLGFELEYAAVRGENEELQQALARNPSQTKLAQALAYAAGQAREQVIDTLLAAGADKQLALQVLKGILHREGNIRDRKLILYAMLYASLLESNRTLPSLQEIIISNRDPEIKNSLFKKLWDLPKELRSLIVPNYDDQAEFFEKRVGRPSAAYLKALSENRDELLIPLIRLVFKEFSRTLESLQGKLDEKTFDIFLQQMTGSQRDIKPLLQALLVFALENEQEELLRLLLKHPQHSDFCVHDLILLLEDPLHTPLHFAALRGDAQALEPILSSPLSFDTRYFSPLMLAIEKGHTHIITNLCNQSLDHNQEHMLKTNISCNEGLSPLRLAASLGDNSTVGHCIEKGCEPSEALVPAAGGGHIEIVKKIIKNCAPLTKTFAFIEACKRGKNDCAFMILEEGRLALYDYAFKTAFHHALKRGHVQTLKLLLTHPYCKEYCARLINHSYSDGSTPLHYACTLDNAQLVDLLIEHGATITIYTNAYNIIEYAIRTVNKGLIDILSPFLVTVLEYAVHSGNTPALKLVLEQANNEGRLKELLQYPFIIPGIQHSLPIIFAATHFGNLEMVKLLVALGADPYEKIAGKTALDFASAADNNDVADYLKSLNNSSFFAPLGALWFRK